MHRSSFQKCLFRGAGSRSFTRHTSPVAALATQLRCVSTGPSPTTSAQHPPRPSHQPSHQAYDANSIAALLSHPELAREVILKLPEAKRREMLVAASYYEWFGDEVKVRADGSADDATPAYYGTAYASRMSDDGMVDRTEGEATPTEGSGLTSSSSISKSKDGDASNGTATITDSNDSVNYSWDEMRKRRRERRRRAEEQRVRREMQEANPMPTFPMTRVEYTEWIKGTVQYVKNPSSNTSGIPFKTLLKVAIQTGLPFMAFGTLDNSMLILAGDLIDNLIGAEMKLSTMGAAAMGGIVSGVVGIQIHGLAERAVSKYGPPQPALKPSQWRSKPVQSAIHWGGTFGLVCGLLLGMFPLLLISDAGNVRRAIEDEDGVSPKELALKAH